MVVWSAPACKAACVCKAACLPSPRIEQRSHGARPLIATPLHCSPRPGGASVQGRRDAGRGGPPAHRGDPGEPLASAGSGPQPDALRCSPSRAPREHVPIVPSHHPLPPWPHQQQPPWSKLASHTRVEVDLSLSCPGATDAGEAAPLPRPVDAGAARGGGQAGSPAMPHAGTASSQCTHPLRSFFLSCLQTAPRGTMSCLCTPAVRIQRAWRRPATPASPPCGATAQTTAAAAAAA